VRTEDSQKSYTTAQSGHRMMSSMRVPVELMSLSWSAVPSIQTPVLHAVARKPSLRDPTRSQMGANPTSYSDGAYAESVQRLPCMRNPQAESNSGGPTAPRPEYPHQLTRTTKPWNHVRSLARVALNIAG
jgi:hypothetical protein